MSNINYSELSNEELNKLAEVGISEAQEECGYRLLKESSFCEKNIDRAMKWFTLSSGQGNLMAIFNLATMYKMGIGVEKDLEKAFTLYQKCAKQGLSAAKYFLGEMYRYGLGTEANEELAIKWITESHSDKKSLVGISQS